MGLLFFKEEFFEGDHSVRKAALTIRVTKSRDVLGMPFLGRNPTQALNMPGMDSDLGVRVGPTEDELIPKAPCGGVE